MALFRKKPADAPESVDSLESDSFAPQPDKARKWFEHARASSDTFNYEYALNCWANGFKLDPEPMAQHEAMHSAAVRYHAGGGKPASGRETKAIDDGTPVGRFAAAEFEWMKDLDNFKLACKCLEASVKAEQFEFGLWMSRPTLLLLHKQKKRASKGQLVALMDLLQSVEAFDASMTVGEMARELDPSDNDLATKMKNLAAERAMSQGGYEQAAGREGGFREFIKDADKQRELMEEETLGAGASTEERNLKRAQLAYDEAPAVADSINRYAQLLKKQGDDESVEQAYSIYLKGYEDTGEYRFRINAGDIRIEQQETRLQALAAKLAETLAENGEDPETKSAHHQAQVDLLELKSGEYTERVSKYPTDRFRKYDLGTVLFELENYDEAMAQFQAAKDEPKLHARAAQRLGRCFMAEKWYAEAIGEFREALSVLEVTDRDRELELKYDLMIGLMALAADERSGDFAREAKELCSEIARKNITYRDIRQKRREIDELIKDVG